MNYSGNQDDIQRVVNFGIDGILSWEARDLSFVEPYPNYAVSPDKQSDGIASFGSGSSEVESSSSQGMSFRIFCFS